MKRIEYTYLIRAFVLFAWAGILSACVGERLDLNYESDSDGSLTVKSTVSEAIVSTRAASVVELNEKQLNMLDVFVEHVTNSVGDGSFINQYHLVATDTKPIQEQVDNWLADNWRAQGLEVGEKYNIYVATNNTQTSATKDLATFNVAALKALVSDEVTDGTAVVNTATNNISWPDDADTPSGSIYKQYVPESGADAVKVNGYLYGFTTEKEFMMDGVIENWTPDATSRNQVFPVTINRAAAKFVLNVNFDADFLKSLTHTKKIVDGTETWVEKPDSEKVTITGSPAWRFYNFAFGATVFAPATQGAGVEVHSSETLLRHPYEYAGEDKNFQIITYSYPNKWASTDYSTQAPSIVISVGYNENGSTNYHYYRIPLVKSTVTAIERNHIYVIKAKIATRGSASQEDVNVTEDIDYAVLPWNDQTNSDAIENHVESVQHYYFNVNPKVYTLRGDGDQSVILNYSKASGTKVNWKLFTYDEDGNQTGVVANDDANAIRAWFYDSEGNFTTKYNDDSGTDWSEMGVNIVQNEEGTSSSKGTITVTSTALNNKAIKYIRLRVYLDEEETFQNGVETMYEDIIIRHFPTDNIQSIDGSWSSYHDASNSTQEVTLTTQILSEAQSWAEQYGVNYTSEEIETSKSITYSEYAAHSSDEGYNANVVSGVSVDEMFYAIYGTYGNWNNTIAGANSQANAVLADSWYYWGENPVEVNSGSYDYSRGRRYYRYTTRYRAQYSHTYTYTQYYVTVPMASTGNWVDWDNRSSHRPARTYTTTYGNYGRGTFNAKVFDDGIYSIVERADGYGNNSNYTTEMGDSYTLTNNHMYVIQISSTSESYVLGRPYVNSSTHQSQDNVVSPAFMIASQLGAVTVFSHSSGAADAATHCSRYMEVAQDGTRYTGWRLPTSMEIKVITDYQYGDIGGVTIPKDYQVLIPVLTGYYYWSLSGEAVVANDGTHGISYGDTDKSYLRCVRDLTAEEVERLNGFDKIQEKYR